MWHNALSNVSFRRKKFAFYPVSWRPLSNNTDDIDNDTSNDRENDSDNDNNKTDDKNYRNEKDYGNDKDTS